MTKFEDIFPLYIFLYIRNLLQNIVTVNNPFKNFKTFLFKKSFQIKEEDKTKLDTILATKSVSCLQIWTIV